MCRRSWRGSTTTLFTTLYWHFLDRHRDQQEATRRLGRPYSTLDRVGDLEAVRERGDEVLDRLVAGRL